MNYQLDPFWIHCRVSMYEFVSETYDLGQVWYPISYVVVVLAQLI